MSLHWAVCFAQRTVRRLSQIGAGIVISVADTSKSALRLFGETAAAIQGDMFSAICDPSWTVSLLSFSCVSISTSCALVGLLLSRIIACCAVMRRVLRIVFFASTSVAF